MITIGAHDSSFLRALRSQWNVIVALMLRDIRTRFFGHGLGYLIMIAWPLTHIAVLLSIYTFLGVPAPYGDSLIVFFSTGVVPFITFMYMARFIMISLHHNAPLLAFPIVKISSIIFARAFLEILTAAMTISLFMLVLWFSGVSFVPRDPLQAIYAIGASLLLGFGSGIINAVIAMAIRGWPLVFNLMIIILWATSGVLFVPDHLPTILRDLVSFNPVMHCIEWLRSAYFDDYGSILLDKSYVLVWGLVLTFNGLCLERLIRGRLLRT